MNIVIDNKSGTPIYDQIYTEIKTQIIDGKLKEGETLPSIKDLAQKLHISVTTTKKAYAALEKEGLVYTIPGDACYVAERNNEIVKEENLKHIEKHMGEILKLGRGAGIGGEEMLEMMRTMMDEGL